MADDSTWLIWSLTASGLGTTLTANGNSGSYTATAQNARTSVDLRRVDDVWLSVSVGTVTGTTPTLKVFLNAYDDQGNLYGQGATPLLVAPGSGSINAAGVTAVFGGRHAGSSGAYFVLSEWGQVSWQVTGTTPVFSGVEIALYAR